MRYSQLLKALILAGSALALSACGYQLRGTNPSIQATQSASKVQIIAPKDQNALAIKQKLATRLSHFGISEIEQTNNKIQLSDITYRQFELVGVLTEIRLVLSAQVHYQLDGRDSTQLIQVERSYQYNEASVTTDQQGVQVRQWLQDSLADRIAERYYALSSKSSAQ